MPIIEIKNLKKYFGRVKAVDDISLEVEYGEVFGFLGPNGAGKTTTIKCMLDFLKPLAGKIKILELDAQKDSTKLKNFIGFLPTDLRLYENWTGEEHLNFVEQLRGKSEIKEGLIKEFDFNPKIKFRELSFGNKQKLGLILALMHKPKILILDEPTIGLDPLLQNIFYKILKRFVAEGTTVFISSHNLHEVETICNRVAIIKAGKIVAIEKIATLKEKKLFRVHLHFVKSFNSEDFQKENIRVLSASEDSLSLEVRGDINPLLQLLPKHQISSLEITRATLEEFFLEFYKDGS